MGTIMIGSIPTGTSVQRKTRNF